MFSSRDKVTRAEIDEIKATAATRKENIRELSGAVSAGHTEINSNRLQINKNTQLIKMLLANGGIQNILGCFYPDRSDADNPITRELCPPPQDGAGRKKRKTRKRRRKKRTKKKTRRKRRKSRKRKPKRRRKKKTRKRKAGCWPFCKPKVRETQPLLLQQQEAPTMTDEERIEDDIARLSATSSGNPDYRTQRRHALLAAREAAARANDNPQGEY